MKTGKQNHNPDLFNSTGSEANYKALCFSCFMHGTRRAYVDEVLAFIDWKLFQHFQNIIIFY